MMKELAGCLRTDLDALAWTHFDMCGISPAIAIHALNIEPKYVLVKPKRRGMDLERSVTLKEEVDKLKVNWLIHDALNPEWVSNHVLVKKENRKWRTCIDYSDLNKGCPKDSFPLSRID